MAVIGIIKCKDQCFNLLYKRELSEPAKPFSIIVENNYMQKSSTS